jgi:hypothetical protein
LPRIRFAVGGSHKGEVKRMTAKADPTPAQRDQEHEPMTGQDAELDLFRNGVNCAALLERLEPVWHLDRKGAPAAHGSIAGARARLSSSTTTAAAGGIH